MSCYVQSARAVSITHTLSLSLSLSLSLASFPHTLLPPPLFSLFPYPCLSTPTRPPPSGHITVVGPDAASVQMAREMLELFTETHELKPHQIDFLSHDYGMLSKLHHTTHRNNTQHTQFHQNTQSCNTQQTQLHYANLHHIAQHTQLRHTAQHTHVHYPTQRMQCTAVLSSLVLVLVTAIE